MTKILLFLFVLAFPNTAIVETLDNQELNKITHSVFIANITDSFKKGQLRVLYESLGYEQAEQFIRKYDITVFSPLRQRQISSLNIRADLLNRLESIREQERKKGSKCKTLFQRKINPLDSTLF